MAKRSEKQPDVDPVLAHACAELGVEPGEVLDWHAYEDRVVLVVRAAGSCRLTGERIDEAAAAGLL